MAAVRRPSHVYPHLLALATYTVFQRSVGAPYLTIADRLRGFYSHSDAARARWQRDQLDRVLTHAAEQVPFYRRILKGRDPTGVQLGDLPIVNRAKIRAAEHSFRSANWQQIPYVWKETGGTTEGSWQFPLDIRSWAHIYGAALFQRERTGYRYGEPVVLLGTPPSLGFGSPGWKAWLRRRIERHHTHLAGFEIDRSASLRRVRQADALGACLWYGYPSTIAAMAEAALAEKIPVTGPRAIITNAEQLLPVWRELIEAAFGAKVYDEYGSNDGGLLAQTCGAGRYHLAENVSIVEILNGDRPCEPGEEGMVTITNLHARTLPFLRYQNGDCAAFAVGPCPCGTPGATIEQVGGRADDHLKLPDGRKLSGIVASYIFEKTPDVTNWQIAQSSPAMLTIRVMGDGGIPQQQADTITEFFRHHCGPEVTVRLTSEEPIERTAAGKRRAIVREFS